MFVADAFLGDFYRQNENWGFLYDTAAEKAEIAPVFDCGGCLLPQADENTMKRIFRDKGELEAESLHFQLQPLRCTTEKSIILIFWKRVNIRDAVKPCLELHRG